jgi:hypothetical protein
MADQAHIEEAIDATADDYVRLLEENARLTEQVRQMGLHSLGCSGKVGTDGVECEWPDEGPCLVADLRLELARTKALLAIHQQGTARLSAEAGDTDG